jgi:hypothetical protein
VRHLGKEALIKFDLESVHWLIPVRRHPSGDVMEGECLPGRCSAFGVRSAPRRVAVGDAHCIHYHTWIIGPPRAGRCGSDLKHTLRVCQWVCLDLGVSVVRLGDDTEAVFVHIQFLEGDCIYRADNPPRCYLSVQVVLYGLRVFAH